MGTDIYHCNLESHTVLSKAEAARRAVAYGYAPDNPPYVLGHHPGPFLELALSIRTVYSDAPVAWDDLMLLRLVDEAVYHAARSDDSGYDFEKTPISERYPGFWTMGFKPERALAEDVVVLQLAHAPPASPPGPRRDWTGDYARVVFYIPQFLAPNLAGFGFWESRAWGGMSWNAERQERELRPWAAEAHILASATRIFEAASGTSGRTESMVSPSLTPRAAGGLWLANRMAISVLDPVTRAQTFVAEIPRPHKQTVITCALEDRKGTLWLGLNKGLARYHPDTGPVLEAEGHAGKEIHALALLSDGRLVVGGVGGLWIREGSTWTAVRQGLLDTTVEQLLADDAGALWAAGSKGLTRRNPDGSLERFQKTQGVGTRPRIAPLPDGALYASAYDGCGRIGRGESRTAPHPALDATFPRGARGGTLASDGTVWAMTSWGLLLRIRGGQPTQAFAFDPSVSSYRHLQLLSVEGGDLWLAHDDGLLCVSAADQARTLETDPVLARRVRPFSWANPKKRSAAIDFNGKSVALTGTLSRLSRDEAAALLRARGATVVGGVTKTTDYLIAGKGAGSKAEKAAKLGVVVLDEDALHATSEASADAEATELSDLEKSARFPRWTPQRPPASTVDPTLMRRLAASNPPLSAEDWAAKLADHQLFLARGGEGVRFENLSVSGLLLTVVVGLDEETTKLQFGPRFLHMSEKFDASGACLRAASLGGMVAPGINLAGADLRRSILIGADLSGANLAGADLSHADLSDALLRGADLRGAILYRTDFERADLSDADLRDTKLGDALFPYTTLDGVRA